MKLVANQQLVKNRVRLGLGFHISALAVFAIGLALSVGIDASKELPLASWGAILLGLVLYTIGQSQLRRWGPRNRQEESLGRAIRALDERYKLYAFLSTALPDYILVSPAGVHVLVARNDTGTVACVRDQWNSGRSSMLGRFLGSGIGNPSADAAQQVQKVRTVLDAAGMTEVPVAAVIVFTNPKVQLRVEGCSALVTRDTNLQDVFKRLSAKGRPSALTSAGVRQVQAVFDERMRSARGWR